MRHLQKVLTVIVITAALSMNNLTVFGQQKSKMLSFA